MLTILTIIILMIIAYILRLIAEVFSLKTRVKQLEILVSDTITDPEDLALLDTELGKLESENN